MKRNFSMKKNWIIQNGWRTTKIWWSMSRRLLKVSFIVFITAHLCVYVICILTNVAAAIFLATKKRILLNFLFILLNFRISYDILCIYFVANYVCHQFCKRTKLQHKFKYKFKQSRIFKYMLQFNSTENYVILAEKKRKIQRKRINWNQNWFNNKNRPIFCSSPSNTIQSAFIIYYIAYKMYKRLHLNTQNGFVYPFPTTMFIESGIAPINSFITYIFHSFDEKDNHTERIYCYLWTKTSILICLSYAMLGSNEHTQQNTIQAFLLRLRFCANWSTNSK